MMDHVGDFGRAAQFLDMRSPIHDGERGFPIDRPGEDDKLFLKETDEAVLKERTLGGNWPDWIFADQNPCRSARTKCLRSSTLSQNRRVAPCILIR